MFLDHTENLKLLHKGWPFVRLYNASSATLTEVPTTPRRLRPKTKAPDPKIPEWPKQEWPKELQDLCKEFEDVLVEELDSEQVVRCPPMDVELLPGTKPFFACRPHKNPLHWKEKVKKEVQELIKQGKRVCPVNLPCWVCGKRRERRKTAACV